MDDDEGLTRRYSTQLTPVSLFDVRRARLNAWRMQLREHLDVRVRQTARCQWTCGELHEMASALLTDVAQVQKRIRASERQPALAAVGSTLTLPQPKV